ncbi:MAG: hypothetical protein NT061_05830 [Spirochaetes bacterium]|nr:hypothetical protein [Spirochaetota bacterium]
MLVLPILAAVAILAFGLWGRTGNAKLYFADRHYKSLVMETRAAPLLGSMEERAEELMSELLLGPMEPYNQPLIQGDARLGSVMHRGGTLFIDVEIVDLAEQKLPFDLFKKAIEQSLSSSVPGSGKLELYINGHQIGS